MNYGLQLYSVRDASKENYDHALRQVAAMGYKMVETAGYYNHSAMEICSWIKKYGLTISGAHIGLQTLVKDLESVIAYHKDLKCKDIIIPVAPCSTNEEVAYLVEQINYIQPVLEKEGMQLHFHNHSKEFIPNKDGQLVEEILKKETNVLFQIDTFWVFNAGLDVIEVLKQYKDRIRCLHLKDGIPQDWNDPESKAKGLSIGRGKVPVAEILDYAKANRLTVVVESEELEPTGLEEVQRCMDYLKVIDGGTF